MGDNNDQTPEEYKEELLKAYGLSNNRKGLLALKKLTRNKNLC